jgi:protease I
MLLLSGGVLNSDRLRMNEKAVSFARYFLQNAKPLAAICYGPQVLIETGWLKNRTMTAYRAKKDLINAGASRIDQEVVVDNGLITSRSPRHFEAFNKKIIEELKVGQRAAKA